MRAPPRPRRRSGAHDLGRWSRKRHRGRRRPFGHAALPGDGERAGPSPAARRGGPGPWGEGPKKARGAPPPPSSPPPAQGPETDPPPPPPISNVASVQSGPFTVTIPIAARYEELTKAMTMAFTDGKL